MYSPMAFAPPAPPPHPGAQTFYSPFPPGHPQHPGAPPGHVIIHPSRQERAREENEEEKEAGDKILKQILLAVGKIARDVKRNDQAFRDITNRLSNVEDRLSIMDQRVLRISSQVDQITEQNKNVDEGLAKATANSFKLDELDGAVRQLTDSLAGLSTEVGDVKGVVNGISTSKIEDNTTTLLSHVSGMMEYTQELGEMQGLKSGVEEIKTLVKEIPAASPAPPPPPPDPPAPEEEAAPPPEEPAAPEGDEAPEG